MRTARYGPQAGDGSKSAAFSTADPEKLQGCKNAGAR
jgi:hypothetical protein